MNPHRHAHPDLSPLPALPGLDEGRADDLHLHATGERATVIVHAHDGYEASRCVMPRRLVEEHVRQSRCQVSMLAAVR